MRSASVRPWRFSMPDDFAAGDRYRSGRAPAGPDRPMIDREDGETSGAASAWPISCFWASRARRCSRSSSPSSSWPSAAVLWLVIVIRGHERIAVPAMFWPLLAYAAATIVSAIFSVDRRVSFLDSKQLRSLRDRADRLSAAPRSADAQGGRRHDHGRGVERGLRESSSTASSISTTWVSACRARSDTT